MTLYSQFLLLGACGHALIGFFYGLSVEVCLILLALRSDRTGERSKSAFIVGWLLLAVSSCIFWVAPFHILSEILFFIRTWPTYSISALVELGAAMVGFAIGFSSGWWIFMKALKPSQVRLGTPSTA